MERRARGKGKQNLVEIVFVSDKMISARELKEIANCINEMVKINKIGAFKSVNSQVIPT